MLKENYLNYQIEANPIKTRTGKWVVSVTIKKATNAETKSKTYFADDNIHYILEVEAAKECINLGKNLINSNMTGI